MRQTRSFSLNDSNEIHKAIIDRLADEASVSSVVINALYNWYFGSSPDGQAQDEQAEISDNSAVVDAINAGFSMLADKLDGIGTLGRVEDVARNGCEHVTMPGGVDATLEEIDPSVDTPFLVGVRNMAKPGMRIQN